MSGRNKIDSKTENCLKNCVDRFIDSNLMVVQVVSW